MANYIILCIMKSHAIIYPGTFDPITNGHLDIITRASHIFEEVIVAVSLDTHKKTLLSPEVRLELVTQSLAALPHVRVVGFSGLLIDFAKQQSISVLLRGVRTIADFEYEQQLACLNQHLYSSLETVFMASSEKYTFISGSFVRDIIRLNGNLTGLVPEMVIHKINQSKEA